MRIVLIIAVSVVVAASFFADYKWRRWLARNRQDRDR
jgi:hypothetical protein